jgi:predicted nucleic acid-binding protein
MSAERGLEALEDLAGLSVRRYPHDIVLPRVWELRANLTAYDAVYVALAEALGAPLLTRDRRIASAARHHARVEVV